jgi:hypothetical protein
VTCKILANDEHMASIQRTRLGAKTSKLQKDRKYVHVTGFLLLDTVSRLHATGRVAIGGDDDATLQP